MPSFILTHNNILSDTLTYSNFAILLLGLENKHFDRKISTFTLHTQLNKNYIGNTQGHYNYIHFNIYIYQIILITTYSISAKCSMLYIEMNIIIVSLSIIYIIFVKLSVKSEGRIFQSKCLFSNPSNKMAKLEYVRVSERMLL